MEFENAIAALRYAVKEEKNIENVPIFLFVDEVEKFLSKLEDQKPWVLSHIVTELDTDRNFDMLISALDATNMAGRLTTTSGRDISWILLKPPSKDAILSIFINHFESKLPPGTKFTDYFSDELVLASSVHWRTIIKLFMIYTNSLPQLKKSISEAKTYDHFLKKLTVKLNCYLTTIQESHVIACFQANTLPLSAEIGNETFSFLISKGVFVNGEGGKAVAPDIAFPMLYHWASTNTSYLAQLVEPLTKFDSIRTGWATCEEFNAHWHAVRAYCCSMTKRTKIGDFYNNLGIRSKKGKWDRLIKWEKEMRVAKIDDGISLLEDVVYIAPEGNPGFDLLMMLEDTMTRGGKRIYFAIEVKHTKKDTKVYLKQVKEKHEALKDFENKLEEWFGEKMKVDKDQVYLIVVAWRGVGTKINEDSLPKNTLVLGGEHLAELYGPMRYRPLFRDWLRRQEEKKKEEGKRKTEQAGKEKVQEEEN